MSDIKCNTTLERLGPATHTKCLLTYFFLIRERAATSIQYQRGVCRAWGGGGEGEAKSDSIVRYGVGSIAEEGSKGFAAGSRPKNAKLQSSI